MAVLSSTVIDTTDTGTSAARGKTPGTRTSCQSEWILQMSTESKYLTGENSESVFVQRFDAFLYSAGHQRAFSRRVGTTLQSQITQSNAQEGRESRRGGC